MPAGLPPVEQVFTVNAAEFIAGIDEMLDSVERLAAGIDEVAASADRLSAGVDAAAGADDRLAAAEEAAEARCQAMVAAMSELGGALDENAAAADRAAEAYDVAAASAAKAGDAAEGAADKTEAGTGVMKTAALGVAIALGIGIEQAAKFQQSMTKLVTQAGVSQSQMKQLNSGVLQLASSVGESPESLAESLYHVESNMQSLGIKAPQALNMVKVAAEGARVGNADLVDVTNALTAAVASGIPGVQNYQQAMGALNATVGAGDMTMQDLADAMGTGMVAVVKGYGLSLRDVGAALATFGDNNIRGAKAGTDLRMAVQAMAVPMATSGAELAKLGMNSQTLADDMEKHGLLYALEDLQSRFKKTGITAKNEGEVITTIFGKKAGAGLSILMEQMDRLKSKYPDIEKAADNFGGAWAKTQQTVAQQWADLRQGADALAISFGQVLLPAALKIVHALASFGQFLTAHPQLAAFAGAILAVAVAFKIAATAEALFDAATDANPVTIIIIAIIALAAALYELYKHCALVRQIVHDLATFFKAVWTAAVKAAGAVIQWFVSGPLAFIKKEIAVFNAFWAAHGQLISAIAKKAWSQISAVVELAWAVISAVIRAGTAVVESVIKVAFDLVVGIVRIAWNVIAEVIRTVIATILDVISLALDVMTGKWGAAWNDVKKLTSDALHGVESIAISITSGFGSLLFNAGMSLIRGLINGIESMIGSLGGVMSKVASVVKSFLPFSPAKQGPLSGSGDPSYSGRSITKKLAQGLVDGSGDVSAAMKRVAASAGLAGAGGGLSVAPAGAGGAAGGGSSIGQIHLEVNGFVGNNQELTQQLYLMFQQATLQNNRRNTTNGLSLTVR